MTDKQGMRLGELIHWQPKHIGLETARAAGRVDASAES